MYDICSNCTVSYLCQSAARQQQVLSRTDPKQFPQGLCIAKENLDWEEVRDRNEADSSPLKVCLLQERCWQDSIICTFIIFYISYIEWLLTLPIHFDSIIHNNPMFNPKVPTFWHSTKWTLRVRRSRGTTCFCLACALRSRLCKRAYKVGIFVENRRICAIQSWR